MKKLQLSMACALTLCATVTAQGGVLIDYNDGVAGGGHDAEVLNGGLSSSSQPSGWTGNYDSKTNLNSPGSAGRNMAISNNSNPSIIDTGHTIAAGESYNIAYSWRDAANWVDNGRVHAELFYTDDNTVTGIATVITDLNSGQRQSNATWETESVTGVLNNDAGSAGKNLFVAIRVDGQSAGRFARFDDLYVEVIPEPGSIALLALGGLLVTRRRRRA